MKRLIFLSIIFSLLISKSNFAQEKAFRFGFHVAPNIGWLKPDAKGYSSDGPVMGFTWGLIGDFSLTENYFISSGFNLTFNNGKLKYPQTLVYSDIPLYVTLHRKYNLKSLEIPLVLKIKTNEFGKFRYFGKIGLGTSFRLSAKGKDEYTSGSVTMKETNNIDSNVRLLRESLIVGAGAEYSLTEDMSAFVGITFDNGFTNILKGKNTVNTSVDQYAITNYFELNVGILF
jgi:hypothetical protein